MYKIFVDQDDVLVNFSHGFEKLGHGSPEEFTEKHGDPALYHLINNKTDHFFLDLDWMPDGKKLWNFVKKFNPTILTRIAPITNCKPDKLTWAKEKLGEDIPIIITTKKEKYASPDAILIDDMSENIEKWRSVGGIGILHISAEQSILELKKLLKNASFHYSSIDALLKDTSLQGQDADTTISILQEREKEDKINSKKESLLKNIKYLRNMLDVQRFEENKDKPENYRNDLDALDMARAILINIEEQIINNNFNIDYLIDKFRYEIDRDKSNPFWYNGRIWIDEIKRKLEALL